MHDARAHMNAYRTERRWLRRTAWVLGFVVAMGAMGVGGYVLGHRHVARTATSTRDGKAPSMHRTTGTVPSPAVGGTSGWLFTSNIDENYLQLDITGTSVQGTSYNTFQVCNTGVGEAPVDSGGIGCGPPNGIKTHVHSIIGSISGNALQLSIGGGPTEFGSISGDLLTLNVAQPNGQVDGLQYAEEPISAYNQGVLSLQSSTSGG